MENETNVLDLSDDDISYMSPDEAKGKIDRYMRAARDDPKHPYIDNTNIDHRRAVEPAHKLFKAASPPDSELATNTEGEPLIYQYWPKEYVEAMKAGMELQEKKQAALVAGAQASIDYLVDNHNYERDEVPKDIQPFVANLLRAQVLNHSENTEVNLDELSRILEKESYAVPFDGKLREAISSLNYARRTLGKDKELAEEFSELVGKIIFKLVKAHEKMDLDAGRGTAKYHDDLMKKVIERETNG